MFRPFLLNPLSDIYNSFNGDVPNRNPNLISVIQSSIPVCLVLSHHSQPFSVICLRSQASAALLQSVTAVWLLHQFQVSFPIFSFFYSLPLGCCNLSERFLNAAEEHDERFIMGRGFTLRQTHYDGGDTLFSLVVSLRFFLLSFNNI